MSNVKIQGAMTAIITPFNDQGVDYDRLGRNVEDQIAGGIDGIVPMGTTGESPTVSHEEHRKVVEFVVKKVAGRVVVLAGAGSNSTAEALELSRHARSVGADAVMLVNPYYNKPTQEGLYRHFATVADTADIPVVLYNIPGRTAVEASAQTIARLASHSNIIAVKEATGRVDMASEILSLVSDQAFSVVSGDDSLTLPLMSVGARGVISVLSNIIPRQVKALTVAALAGNYAEARRLHLELFPLFKGMFVETNPIPIKTAMQLMGRDSGLMRLPLCEPSPANLESIRRLLTGAGLLK